MRPWDRLRALTLHQPEAQAARVATLENQGSTARDHLANERTFLAWVRTALGVIGLGIVLEKIVGGGALTTFAGGGLVVYGTGILAYALLRYRSVTQRLQGGQFPVAQSGPLVVGLVGLVVAVGAIVLVLT